MQLKDMPDSIIEQAKRRLKKNPHRYHYGLSYQLPKRSTKQVLKRNVPSVGEGTVAALIKRLEQAAAAADKKGATQTLVCHAGIEILAYRQETQQEFERRYEDAVIDRAARLLRHEADEKAARNKRKAKTTEERLRAMTKLQEAVRQLGFGESKKIIDGLIDGVDG